MPRPYPPPPLSVPTVQPFNLGDPEKRDLARVLGLACLPPAVSDMIAEAIAVYKAAQAGSADTTVKNTIAALSELKKKGRAYDRAVRRLADDRSGVDDTTLDIIQPFAKAVIGNEPGAREKLTQAAHARAEELRKHKRVQTSTEPLRFFCGVLRLIF